MHHGVNLLDSFKTLYSHSPEETEEEHETLFRNDGIFTFHVRRELHKASNEMGVW
jgi:hypothetical protein